MSDFWRYLRSRLALMLFLMGAAALFTVAFALYHLPLAAAAYPAALTLAAGLCALGVGYGRYARKCRALRKLQEAGENLPNLLPAAKEPLEAEYQALAVRLCARHQAREEEISGQYRERIAYYTLWAHQIKTPIAAMGLTLQNQDTALSRQLMGQLTRISQYADMALAYLRLDSEHTDYVIRSCDLDAVIREAVKKFSGEFIRRGIHLEYKGVNQKVITDEKWLEFVLEQLISNALKYTPAGSVAIYQEPGPTLCVADTGIGIAPEDLPRIFENGYTGINGRRDKRASGIGLYLFRRVCQNLGHEISAESTPGKGATIRLNLARRESTYE